MSENNAEHSPQNNTFRERVGSSLLNKKGAILGAIITVLLIDQILKFTLPDFLFLGTPLALLAVWLISWLKQVGWPDLGLYRPNSWAKTVLLALVAVLLVQTVAYLQIRLSNSAPDYSSYEQALTPWGLLGWILISWLIAGFGEEVIWRGFFMKQIARLLGEHDRASWVVGLVISSVGFGLIHFHQGPGGMLGTGFAGLVYGIIYLVSGRNLWTSILAHGLTGTSSFIVLYLSQVG